MNIFEALSKSKETGKAVLGPSGWAQWEAGAEYVLTAEELLSQDWGPIDARKTKEEIDALKKSWEADAVWDIEDTPGFEAHHEELLTYRKERELRWENERRAKLLEKAYELGVAGNTVLAGYLLRLENRLIILENKVDKL